MGALDSRLESAAQRGDAFPERSWMRELLHHLDQGAADDGAVRSGLNDLVDLIRSRYAEPDRER